jgi:hypothetical protein
LVYLEIELFQFNEVLFGKILKQESIERGFRFEHDGFVISHSDVIGLEINHFYAKGNERGGDFHFITHYQNSKQAARTAKKLRAAIIALNENTKPIVPITKISGRVKRCL